MAHLDPYAADVWAAGMILLEVATLEHSVTLYNTSKCELFQDRLKERVGRAVSAHPFAQRFF
jgi:hypothetical protein